MPMSPRQRVRFAVRVAPVLFVVWLLLDGVQNIAVGVVATALGTVVAGLVPPLRPIALRLVAVPGFAVFFVIESFRGAVDVAWRAMHPSLPIVPHLECYSIRLPLGPARTMFVGVVSLLPGTLSADLPAEDSQGPSGESADAGDTLVVHAITGDPAEGLRRLEVRIGRLFGVDLGPDDGKGAR